MYWKVEDVAAVMESRFPRKLAEEWDNPGLQVGSLQTEVRQALIALDLDEEAVQKAIQQNASLIITHHPFIFKALHSIDIDKPAGRIIRTLIKHDIAVFCAHTNLDAAPDGLNDWLAEAIGLNEVGCLPGTSSQRLYKLVVYVPRDHQARVREAMARAGAGHVGAYSDCSFRVAGTGTFRPGPGSQPFIGTIGDLEEVSEYRLETVASSADLSAVIKEMLAVHPYEEPAYDIFMLENSFDGGGVGRIGMLPEPVKLEEFCALVRSRLNVEVVRAAGRMDQVIGRVAVVGGAGASFIKNALDAGADVLLTGDVKYHEARDAQEAGIAIVDAGHYGTEIIMVQRLADELNQISGQQGMKTIFRPCINSRCFTEIY